MRAALCRLALSIGVILSVAPLRSGPGRVASAHATASQEGAPSDDFVRGRVSVLIKKTIEQSRRRLADGSYATVMPILPSNEDSVEITRYGERAIKVLATYVSSDQSAEQHVALRFLLQFQNELAFGSVQAFAEKSTFAGIRQEAIGALQGFPPSKIRGIVERISIGDPSPEVRAYARRVFSNLPTNEDPRPK
jgi:hypothetical protein